MKVDGNKTYVMAGMLLVYVLTLRFLGHTPDPTIVTAFLAGMGLTLRHAMAKQEPRL